MLSLASREMLPGIILPIPRPTLYNCARAMSVKTCQLCGKPLGRRRSDGDFCSREHRNQFQLRRGMDRLEEANKVANLMRRRETPKPIPAARLAVGAAREFRALLDAAPFSPQAADAVFRASSPMLYVPRIADRPGQLVNPMAAWSRRAAAQTRFVEPVSLPFSGRAASSPVLGPLNARGPAAGVVQAQWAPLARQVPASGETLRECGAVLRVSRAIAVPRRRFEVEVSGRGALDHARRLRQLSATPVLAPLAEPRASAATEFCRRAPVMRPRAAHVGTPGHRARSQQPQAPLPPALDLAVQPRTCAIPRPERAPSLPDIRPHHGTGGAPTREALPLQPAAYEPAAGALPRLTLVAWQVEAPAGGPQLRYRGFTGAVAPATLIPFNCACDAARDHRPAQVRFAPADSFELAPIELYDAMGPADSDATRPVPIEENFNSGLDQWTGDTSDWKLDAAGARPGGLALFRPTLTMTDYEFEFFTRIEARAVTFVFRSSNVSNHMRVTIAIVESGRYELRRCAVIGGVEETPAVAPLPGVLRPGAAFTVKVRAWQNDFTIWLDGEVAARWTDGRLPSGGIGFVAPRNDRARVYWVRLSPSDGPNSQAAALRPARSIQ